MDDEPPEVAARSMRDIERINKLLGGNEVTRALIRSVAPSVPFSVLDVGAGGGQMGRVIRHVCPHATVTSLDYRAHQLARAPHPKVAADAFRMPFRPKTFDVVFCSLFLHHFEDDEIVRLLRSFGDLAKRAVLVNDLERHWLAYWFLPATRWLFRWAPVTLYDGPISVRASFTPAELEELCRGAGLREAAARSYRPAFRIGVVARP